MKNITSYPMGWEKNSLTTVLLVPFALVFFLGSSALADDYSVSLAVGSPVQIGYVYDSSPSIYFSWGFWGHHYGKDSHRHGAYGRHLRHYDRPHRFYDRHYRHHKLHKHHKHYGHYKRFQKHPHFRGHHFRYERHRPHFGGHKQHFHGHRGHFDSRHRHYDGHRRR